MKNDRKNRNRPSHGVYVVEGEGDNAYWTKIGSAWTHDDGDGFNIQLTALPLTGRIVVRKPRKDTAEGERD